MTRPTASEQLSAWIDGELTDAEAAELEAELARDPSLRAELEQLEAVVHLLHTDGPVSAPEGFEARTLARVERERIPGLRLARVRRPLGVPLEVWGLGLAAAAALVVTVLPTLGTRDSVLPEPAAFQVRPLPELRIVPPGSAGADAGIGEDRTTARAESRGRGRRETPAVSPKSRRWRPPHPLGWTISSPRPTRRLRPTWCCRPTSARSAGSLCPTIRLPNATCWPSWSRGAR